MNMALEPEQAKKKEISEERKASSALGSSVSLVVWCGEKWMGRGGRVGLEVVVVARGDEGIGC
jgi:hypothetical protein